MKDNQKDADSIAALVDLCDHSTHLYQFALFCSTTIAFRGVLNGENKTVYLNNILNTRQSDLMYSKTTTIMYEYNGYPIAF